MIRRLAVLASLSTAAVVWGAPPVLAHGVGDRADLPVPPSIFAIGAGSVLIVTAMTLVTNRQEPRFQEQKRDRPLRARWLRALYAVARPFGLAMFALVVAAGLFDGTSSVQNIAPVTVWVGFWLLVPILSVGAGDLWRRLSPYRTLAGWVNGHRPERGDLAGRIGMWPAVAWLLAFAWLQLVYPYPMDPLVLGSAALVYLGWILIVTRWAGVEAGHEIGGAFHHYNRLVASIAPVGVGRPEGVGTTVAPERRGVRPELTNRGWLRALPHTVPQPGLVAFVAGMIGIVTYDGVSVSDWWSDLWGTTARTEWFGTLALVATVAAVYGIYLGASWVIGRLAQSAKPATDIAVSFVHTLVPVAIALVFAHYFTTIIFEGQQFLHAASDPFGFGWDLFGTADWRVEFWLSSTAVWYVALAAIVAGHVAAVVLAYDRALAEFGHRNAAQALYGILLLMILLTSLAVLVLA